MIMMNNTEQLSIAVNESAIRYALFSDQGELKVRKSVPTPTDNIDNFLKAIYHIVEENQKISTALELAFLVKWIKRMESSTKVAPYRFFMD